MWIAAGREIPQQHGVLAQRPPYSLPMRHPPPRGDRADHHRDLFIERRLRVGMFTQH